MVTRTIALLPIKPKKLLPPSKRQFCQRNRGQTNIVQRCGSRHPDERLGLVLTEMKAFLLIPGVASESLYPLTGRGLFAGFDAMGRDECFSGNSDVVKAV
jgi:hypothetical protein